jgi:hypothetical protein
MLAWPESPAVAPGLALRPYLHEAAAAVEAAFQGMIFKRPKAGGMIT